MNTYINNNAVIKFEIENTLSTLHTVHKNWVRLQQMTEDKLYKLLQGSLELCYLASSTDAHMSAFKECCGFKWGRKTKLSVLVAKAVFGADAGQVHNYAKVLENAIGQKIGTQGHADMLTWLRSNGGISGITRGGESTSGSKGSSKSNVIELERAHTVSIGRNAEDYGVRAKFKFAVSEKYIDTLHTNDVVLLCKVDRLTNELAVYWTDNDSDVVDKYYACVGENVKTTGTYAKREYEKYAEKQAAEAVASFEISDKFKEIAQGILDEDEVLEAAA